MAAATAAVVALHVAAGWLAEGPVVHGDEGAYLRIARYLGGDGPVPGVKYFPGYSLLLVPFEWALDGPRSVFQAVKGLNAVLGALLVPTLYVLAGRMFPALRPPVRLGLAVTAAIYPSFLLFSNHAFAENALVPGVVLAMLGVGVLLTRRPHPVGFAGVGALAAFLVVIHPRAVGVAVAVVAIAVVWFHRRADVPRMLALAAGLAVTLALGYLLVRHLGTGAEPGSSDYTIDRVWERRASVRGVVDMAVGAAGQVLYVIAATWGVAALAAVPIVSALGRVRRGSRTVADGLLALAGLQFVTVLGVSAAFIAPSGLDGRPDTAIYGRYVEAVLAPVLLVGLVHLVDVVRRRRLVPLAAVAVAALGAAVAVEVWQEAELMARPPDNPFNTLAFYPVITKVGTVEPLLMALLAVVGLAGLLVVGRFGWRLVPVALGVVFLAFTFRMSHYHLPVRHYEVRAQERVLVGVVRQIESVPGVDLQCVGLDRVTAPIYHFENYRFWIDSARLGWFSSDWSERPCGPVVLSGRADLDRSYPGARFVARERWIDAFLWVLPGTVQERAAAGGLLPPDSAPVPSPEPAP